MPTSTPEALNTLSAGLILISAFAMVATRQVQGVRTLLRHPVSAAGRLVFPPRIWPQFSSPVGARRHHARG